MQRNEDPGPFTILYTIRLLHFVKALCNFSASINVMSLYVYKN